MASLGGNRDAFGVIVTRYQSLLCSLAYSAVGDFKQSEDIAQEAFVEAWTKLDTLREPEKLKSWLCGILRFKVSRYRRKEANQPIQGASELEQQEGHEMAQAGVEEDTINEQEQALLWQALEKVPETYREPLILYYREQGSVEQVARELELSEDAVKQRLSRGRKLLQKAMLSFVEQTLVRSKPGTAFAVGVLAIINGIAPPAKAAALGAGAAKAGSLFKWASVLTLLASISGVISSFFSVRAGLDQSRTQRERRRTLVVSALFIGVALIYVVGMFGFKYLALGFPGYEGSYAIASQVLVFGFVASYLVMIIRSFRGTKELRAQERIENPDAFQAPKDQPGAKQREYKSRLSLAGVPLVHFRLGMPEQGDKPVVGWIAGGEVAYGLLFAWGGVAVAPISVGIVAFGLLPVGAIGIGLFATGTVAIGVIAFGASAVAYKAYASMSALGWESAVSGGFSMAKEAAIGTFAFAEHINNDYSAELANLTLLNQTYLWVLAVITLLVIAPAVWYANKVRQRMRTFN